MDREQFDVVIVGAGHGGAQAAIALRQNGYTGTIAMIGREPEPPYERPPLSKEYLAGEKPFERILIRPRHFWMEKNIQLKLGFTVLAVDAAAKELTLNTGETLGYGNLIWAAGGDARKLTCPGADLAGVHTVRNKADIDRLSAQIDAGARRAIVVGGGYIGLEAAAVLAKLGCEVTLLEALPRVLARVAGVELSRFFEAEHRAHGVEVRLNTTVDRIVGDGLRATGVIAANGERLRSDVVIVGIGIVPAVEPLLQAGAVGHNGVAVDEYCRTSLPDIFAIGDCASHRNRFAAGEMIRLESVQNANDMAVVAAKAISGQPVDYHATPWFWSNQFDLKLQTVGLSAGSDATVVRGDPAHRSFSIVYLRNGRVIALDCVNAVKDYVQGRKLVEASAVVPLEQLADTERALNSALAQANACDLKVP